MLTCPNSEYRSNGENRVLHSLAPVLKPTGLVPVLLSIDQAKLERRLVVQTAMWSVLIIVPPPGLDYHLRFYHRAKPFKIQTLVA